MTIQKAPDQDLIWRLKANFGPSTPAVFQTDTIIALGLQVLFALSMLPSAPANLIMTINGQTQTQGLDYTVAGAVVTWLNTEFLMGTGDEVIFNYEV
jgi:hypothetical protein